MARSLGGKSPSPSAAAIAAAQSGQLEAQRAAREAQNALKRATLSIQAMQASQQAARDAARLQLNAMPSGIPHGLGIRGLQVAPGAVAGSDLWQGANLPTEFTDGDRTKVAIGQTQASALLTWQTFNISEKTDLTFNQQGHRDWVAFNRVLDNTAPSRILGSIKADGSVYIINRNGIIFGGTSQVNVGTLIASALPINDALLNAGILYGNPDAKFTFSAYSEIAGAKGPTDAFAAPAATPSSQTSKVVVEAGAIISATSAGNNGGRVVLVGPEVINKGTILTPNGQTILAAGQQVALLPHASDDPSLRGLDVYVGSILAPVVGIDAPSLTTPTSVSDVVTGTSTNAGLIVAERGNITIAGANINQLGVLQSTTSVSLNGRIDLQAVHSTLLQTVDNIVKILPGATGLVTLGPGSLTQILPELDSTERVVGTSLALSSAVNITGKVVHLEQNAHILAPSGDVTIKAANYFDGSIVYSDGQIYLDTGAAIDVFGSIVQAPVSDNIIKVQLLGPQLADSPLQRDGFLRGKTIYVDIRQTGTRADGSTWIGTPLADISGYVGLIKRPVGELTTGGGSVVLNAGASAVMQAGAVINVSNGYIDYQGGLVHATTRLLGANGGRYDISQATPDLVYVGFADEWTRSNARWGVSETWTSLARQVSYQSGYIHGGVGGSIGVQAPTAALAGALQGNVVRGERQRSIPPAASSFTLTLQGSGPTLPELITPAVTQDVIIQSNANQPAVAAFDPNVLSLDPANPIYLSPDLVGENGFGKVSITSGNGDIRVVSALTGGARGSLSLAGRNIEIGANIIFRGGTLDFKTLNLDPNLTCAVCSATDSDVAGRGTLVVGSNVTLSTAGLIVDDLGGAAGSKPLALDGGSISLAGLHLDLKAGSVIDVSGGVAIGGGSKPTNGRGGAIALVGGSDPRFAYRGDFNLGAELKGYAVSKGGSLSITAPRIEIGGTTAGQGTLLLAPDFFNRGGFADFALTGVEELRVASGTLIAPAVKSYGLAHTADGFALKPTLLPAELRSAVSLALNAGGISTPGDLVIEEGAVIRLDPTLAGAGRVSINNTPRIANAKILGSIVTPGGAISIAGNFTPLDLVDFAPNVVLGSSSVLSATGTTLRAVDAQGRRLDRVLDGGSIRVSGNIVAKSGALLDVSGTSGVIELPVPSLSRSGTPTRMDSNGGSITFAGKSALSIAATLRGEAGGANASGGSLTVSVSNFGLVVAPNLTVTQHVSNVSESLSTVWSGAPQFAIDTFSDSGLDQLTLGGNVHFAGPVAVTARRGITVASGGLLSADNAVSLKAAHVTIGAPFGPQPVDQSTNKPYLAAATTYVTSEQGAVVSTVADPTYGAGSLSVDAALIDVGTLSLQTIAQTHLNATAGDIRGYGTFVAQGDITLTAGQIYPTTATTFTVAAFDHGSTPGSVTINAAGRRALPLSAGGTLNIFASTIRQNGVLRAPFGVINLGSTTPQTGQTPVGTSGQQTFATTSTLTLGAGSITSVSAIDPLTGKGMIIPFGTELNGKSWIDAYGNDITAGGVPAKTINLASEAIEIGTGATLDLRGGGDLTAYNWVKGLRGSTDVLASSSSFAVLPGYQSEYAPLVSIVTSVSNGQRVIDAGWSNNGIAVGDRVWLDASSGLPAGYYTLLPARYALMPGAFLVTPKGAGTSRVSIARPDGSSVVSGYRSNSFDPSRGRSALPDLFEVASGSVVHARAQYDEYSANAALRKGALANDAAVPRLPIDAGQLVLSATSRMDIKGQALMSAPAGGLGGLVDIGSSNDIVINTTGTGSAAGTLYLNATGLSAFGAESLLIGGIRSTTSAGTEVKVTTGNIKLDNDETSALYGREIILAANSSIVLSDGAVVEQRGSLSSPAQTLLIGDAATAGSGNGALLRVSSDAAAKISRSGVAPGASGSFTAGAGVRISGNSVILDSTGLTEFDSTARLSGRAVTLGSGQISIVLDNPGALQPTTGLVLPRAVLSNLQATIGGLALQSYSSIDLYGTGAIGAVDGSGRPTLESLTLHAPGLRGFNTGGGSVVFNAKSVSIDNATTNGAPVTVVAGVNDTPLGALVINAETIQVGANAFNVVGYEDLNLVASNGMLMTGTGELSTASNLAITASVVTASTGAKQKLKAGAALTVNAAAGTPSITGGIGAELALAGARVDMNGNVALQSGRLTLQATGAAVGSDVTVRGKLDVSGTAKAFYDQVKYTGGGQIVLTSDNGSVNLAAGSIVSVAAPTVAGDAGSLKVSAAKGTFTASGTLLGQAGANGKGGVAVIDVGTQPTLAALNATLNSGGFNAARAIRVRSGDVLVDGYAKTGNFSVAADSGSVVVTGTIDAAGVTGGQIGLFGYNGVTLASGSVLTVAAQKLDAAGKGGTVDLETGQAKLIGTVMTSGVGWLDLQAGSAIDLSVAGGPGGTLHLRAPQITGVNASGNPIPTLVNSTTAGSDVAIKKLAGAIKNASSVVVEGFHVFDLTSGATITAAVQANLNANAQAFTANTIAITNRLLTGTPNAGLGGKFHVRPGEELVSRADLTLPNLAAANAPATVWNLSGLRYGPGVIAGVAGSGEPGILTLRAAGNLIFKGSLSDGFMPGTNDLLPAGSQSWSYRLVAGADLTGAEFRQVLPLTRLADTAGSVQVGVANPGICKSPCNATGTTNSVPVTKAGFDQLIRTGTGDIDIAAGRDVQLLSQFSTIYTAGTKVAPGNSTTSTLNPGGIVNIAANLPVFFPNGTSGSSVTSTVDGVVTIVNPVSAQRLPAGTVYSFANGAGGGTGTVQPIASQSQITTTVLGATFTFPSGGGTISGFAPGATIYVNSAAADGVIASGPGVLYAGGVATSFNAGDTLPYESFSAAGMNRIVLTNGGALTTSGSGTLAVPAGAFTLTTKTAPTSENAFSFAYVPAGTTLRLLDSSGGAVVYAPGASSAPAPAKFVATVPLAANTPLALPAGSSVTLSGSGALTLTGGDAAVMALPQPDVSGNTYVFDRPIVGSEGRVNTQSNVSIFGTLFNQFSTPQYSTAGGNIAIAAGRDIIHLTTGGVDDSSQQLPVNWLYRRSSVEDGVFARGYNGDMASTTWWIDYSNFYEGVGTLGGGNLAMIAGRDVKNVDGVVPTNAWMPYQTIRADGSVDALAAHQPLFAYGGGDLVVDAGRNINAGVYYVEKGRGVLKAGGSILTNATRSATINAISATTYSQNPLDWLPTTLFLGKGSFDLSARGDVLLGSVANPFLLPQGILNGTWARSYFSTYDAADSVAVSSLTGAITLKENSGEEVMGPGTLGAWFGNVLATTAVSNNNGKTTVSKVNRPWLKLTELTDSFKTSPSLTRTTWRPDIQQAIGQIARDYRGQLELMPPSLEVVAFSDNINIAGSITLAPSPKGNVGLFAAGSIDGLQRVQLISGSNSYGTGSVNLSDVDPDLIPGIRSPMQLVYTSSPLPLTPFDMPVVSPVISTRAFSALFRETGATKGTPLSVRQGLHDKDLLHRNDPDPVHVYAGAGDISGLLLYSPKSARVMAGRDITDIGFYLQNLNGTDTSQVIAGRDIVPFNENSSTRRAKGFSQNEDKPVPPLSGDISIGGVGELQVLAGRNLDLGGTPSNSSFARALTDAGTGLGIVSIGNDRNPYLPFDKGASIVAGAGLGSPLGAGLSGSRLDVAGFVSAFLDPATAGALAARYLPELGARLGMQGASDQEVWTAFNTTSAAQKAEYALDIFYLVLRDAGRDHNAPEAVSRNYENGYAAIAKLFPSDGWQGDISLTAREIKTTSGGDISLFAPGGELVVGFDLGSKQPLDQGILTLGGGDISIFTKGNVTVGTSRVFTFKGGNEIIWSTSGNIAAGSASKTLQSAPPARYLIDPETGVSVLDLAGLATGGGIGVLQTLKDVPPADVDLIAPSGTIDAGDAGIRSSGNVTLAALQIVNAFNIEAQGITTGVPTIQAPNIGGLTEASNTAGAGAQSATTPRSDAGAQPSVIIVEVIGFGGGDGGTPCDEEERGCVRQESQMQDPQSRYQVVGAGALTGEQAKQLAEEKRKQLRR
jgi:filamentous hemagglutinin family protein